MRFLFITVSLMLAATVAGAASIDVASSFPAFQGENGFVAEAYNPDTGAFRALSDLSSVAPQFFGTPEQIIYMPSLRLVAEGVRYLPAWQRSVYGTEWPVLTFVAPVSGYYAVSGCFSNGNAYGATTAGHVFVNDAAADPLFSGNVTNTQTASFDIGGLYLNAGDLLRFGVDSLEGDACDNTILNAVILTGADVSEVPEPGTLAALCSGLLGLVSLRRRIRS